MSITWKGPTDALVEQANSPRYIFADRATIIQTFKGPFALCVSSALSKGTFGSGDLTGFMVASSEVTKEARTIGQLVIVWEAYSAGSGQALPPDDYGVSPFEINPELSKHPRYSSANLTDAQVRAVYDEFNKRLSNSSVAVPAGFIARQAEMFNKLVRGNDSFYMAGLRYSWTRAYWTISGTLDLGGYREAAGGPLASLFPGGLSWMRQADDLVFTGQYYRYTVSWLGAPASHWDTDLY